MLGGAARLGEAPVPPVWVLGAANDAMIMPPQIREVANYFKTEAVMLDGVAHDIMLVRYFLMFSYFLNEGILFSIICQPRQLPAQRSSCV